MLYTGNKLKEILFPLGGIGTGSICLAGNGCLADWEIFNRPDKGSTNPYSFFAVKAEFPNGKAVTKILQGDCLKELSGRYSPSRYDAYGCGPDNSSLYGLPHFKKVRFKGEFPIATVSFEDDNFPAKVILKAFNPFIPLDADNSSIPAAFFDIAVKSYEEDVKYTVLFSIRNPFKETLNLGLKNGEYTAVTMKHSGVSEDNIEYGDMTVAVDSKDGICQEYWYRGRWRDKATTFWHEFTNGTLKDRHYDEPGEEDVCSVGAEATLKRGRSESFRFVLSWNVPNAYNYWEPQKDKKGNDITWKNYYTSLFKDSAESCLYSLKNFDLFYKKTNRFRRSLYTSTLDRSVIDAVSSTLSVLKTPTTMRLEDGTFYGWEGLNQREGSCEGTCTHVWSYAYALCFLFPELERSLRDTEFKYNTEPNGEMHFRTALPLGSNYIDKPPCVDGQMATVIKIYRDWKLTGNSRWLKSNWNNIKCILEYAWAESNQYEWDKNRDGVLEGRQHHTLDMELFGPSSWLQGMYLAALKAAAEMAEFVGDTEKSREYTEIFRKGYNYTKDNLFNGSYFFHKVDLSNKEYVDRFKCDDYWNEEKYQLKYQIGEGCEIDQMLGQWHANICGLGDIFDKEQRQIALKTLFKNNFKESLREFANVWRVFALNDEGGAVICDYPEGCEKPVIPIPYCEECMTGFEYALAGLLISEGFKDEGLKIVKAIRNRYDGEKRNPWNEIECGSNYARAMASYALLPIFSGFSFDVPKKHIGFSPVVSGDFKCVWSLGSGWGDFIRNDYQYKIVLADGSLELESVRLDGAKVKNVYADGKPISFVQQGNTVTFNSIRIKREIRFEV